MLLGETDVLFICWATVSASCALLSSLLTNKDDDDPLPVWLSACAKFCIM